MNALRIISGELFDIHSQNSEKITALGSEHTTLMLLVIFIVD
jgi:hypothetical protein